MYKRQTLVSVTSNGNISFHQAGAGINFSNAANSHSGATSSVLDDYEEGTWSPVLTRQGASTNATITVPSDARYVKVGQMVTVNVYISVISNFPTDGSNAIITGLPFAANEWVSGTIGYGSSTNSSSTTWALNSSTGYFLNSNNNGFRSGTVDLNRGMFTITYTTSE